MIPFIAAAAVGGLPDLTCQHGTICANYNNATASWDCTSDPKSCSEANSVMLHMRVGSATATNLCFSDGDCDDGGHCVARQCHESLLDPAKVVAASVCASLGPEWRANISDTAVMCAGGNLNEVPVADRLAISCALCAGLYSSSWGSTLAGPEGADELSCKLTKPKPDEYVWQIPNTHGATVKTRLVVYALDEADPTYVQANRARAGVLLHSLNDPCTEVKSGESIRVVKEGACFTLSFDESVNVATFRVPIKDVHAMVVFAEHNAAHDAYNLELQNLGVALEPVHTEVLVPHDERVPEDCACIAESPVDGFNIDCNDLDQLRSASLVLEECGSITTENCAKPGCRRAFLILQTHRDYCADPAQDVDGEYASVWYHETELVPVWRDVCLTCNIQRDSAEMCIPVTCETGAAKAVDVDYLFPLGNNTFGEIHVGPRSQCNRTTTDCCTGTNFWKGLRTNEFWKRQYHWFYAYAKQCNASDNVFAKQDLISGNYYPLNMTQDDIDSVLNHWGEKCFAQECQISGQHPFKPGECPVTPTVAAHPADTKKIEWAKVIDLRESTQCNNEFGDNIFVVRERTYEVAPVTEDRGKYLMVGILPHNAAQQMRPHTATPPLYSSSGRPFFRANLVPPQLTPWNPYKIPSELWRFVSFGNDDSYSNGRYGLNPPVDDNGVALTGPVVPDALCSLIPPIRVGRARIFFDPYCCGSEPRLSGCTTPEKTSYGLNHDYMRRPEVCGKLTAAGIPYANGNVAGGSNAVLPPYSDFLVVAQRWTGTYHGRATVESVTDIDRRQWNDNNPCRPVTPVDWCLRRDRGVTANDGTCVYSDADGSVVNAGNVCLDNGAINAECSATVFGTALGQATTTPPPAAGRSASRCHENCSMVGCGFTYTENRYALDASTENDRTTFMLERPHTARSPFLCEALCQTNKNCKAYTNGAGYADNFCTHWYAVPETPDRGGAMDVIGLEYSAVNGDCFNTTFDVDVTDCVETAESKQPTPTIDACYRVCEETNCTALAYQAATGMCATGDLTLPSITVETAIVNVTETRPAPGDGAYAVRTADCTCNITAEETSPPTFAPTRGMPEYSDAVAFYGDAASTKGRAVCPSDRPWACVLYRTCRSDRCKPFSVVAALSKITLYYDPSQKLSCYAERSSCSAPQVLFDATISTAATTTPNLVVAAAASDLPTPDKREDDPHVVEIVISSVIGTSGLLLIGAGYYYRKKLRTFT